MKGPARMAEGGRYEGCGGVEYIYEVGLAKMPKFRLKIQMSAQ